MWLESSIKDIHSYLLTLCDENDFIGVSINSDTFIHGSAGLSMRPVSNFFMTIYGI